AVPARQGDPVSTDAQNAQPFDDARGLRTKALIVGLVFTLISLGLIFGQGGDGKRAALFGYLVSFAYWAGIAFAALVLVMIFLAFRSKWTVVVRRPAEAMASTLWLFL